ncbi:MAG: Ig domain-containing protein, partial [Nitrosopumilus sp.]
MRIKLAISGIFLLLTVMMIPAYAEVSSVDLAQSFYRDEEGMVFEGKSSPGKTSVFVIIRDDDGDYIGMLSDPSSDEDGTFSTIGRQVEDIFSSRGVYFATAFTDDQKEKDGLTIEIEYDGDKVFLVPNFDLQLKTISDKTVEEEETLSFIAGVTASLSDLEYSLEKNPPLGTTINSETGEFTWRSTSNQAPGSYTFDIVVKKGGLEDRESVTVTVTEKPTVQQQPTTQQPTTNQQQPTIPESPKELGLAPFVDETKDPQYYVDRYNNEASYKE